MKAIETRYAGHRFRSRTEARWAIFFDHAQIAWKYEPQGVVLKSGPYLPDFWLSEFGCWFEVKGSWDQVEDVSRFHDLALESEAPVLLAAGRPVEEDQIQVFWPTQTRFTFADTTLERSAYVCPILCQFIAAKGKCVLMSDQRLHYGRGPEDFVFTLSSEWRGPQEGQFLSAIRAAQDARFEHGEQHKNEPPR